MSYWQNSFVIPDMLLGTLCCMIRELSCFWQRTFLALLVQCVEQGLWNCWASVSPSVFLSHLATTCCCGEFAAVGLAGRRYRLIIARLACNSSCKQCRIVSWRRLVKLAILFCVCTPPCRLRGIMHPWFDFWFRCCIHCSLVCVVCFPTYPFFSSLFITFLLPYLSPPLLIFSFENRSAPLSGRMLLKATKRGFSFFLCLSGARCRLAYGPADATTTHSLLLL